MVNKSLLLFLIPFSSFALSEQACPNIDLLKLGESMEGSETLNQGENGFCYAYTAVQMEKALRKVLRPGNKALLSPEHLVLKLKSYLNEQEIGDDGYSSDILSLIIDNGRFLREGLPKGKAIKRNWTETKICSDRSFKATVPGVTGGILLMEKTTSGTDLPSLDVSKEPCEKKVALPVRSEVKSLSPVDMVDTIITEECSPKMRLTAKKDVEIEAFPVEYEKVTAAKISELLTRNEKKFGPGTNLPVEIGLCSGIWKGDTTNLHDEDGYLKLLDDRCVPHRALVVGQRFAQGTCQFKIRNSWGKGCKEHGLKGAVTDKYIGAVECDSNGDIWMDADYLSLYSSDLTSLALPKDFKRPTTVSNDKEAIGESKMQKSGGLEVMKITLPQ